MEGEDVRAEGAPKLKQPKDETRVRAIRKAADVYPRDKDEVKCARSVNSRGIFRKEQNAGSRVEEKEVL